MVKLSVIVPVYNVEKYISECLDSILNTKYIEEIEVIVINDGSIDNTKNICKEYSLKYENVKFFNNKVNKGVSYSRNKGMEKANGKYLMFVDGDDYLDKDWYLIIRDKFKLKKDIILFNKTLDVKSKKLDIIYNIFCINLPYIPEISSKIYSRKFFIDNNIKFNPLIMSGEDMLLNADCLLKCSSFGICNESFYNYRLHLGACTKSFNPNFFDSNLEYYSCLLRLLNNSLFSDDVKTRIVNNFIYTSVYHHFHRLSFISYFKNKELYRFVFYDPYKVVLTKVDNTNDYYLKLNVFFFLVRCRLFFVIWLILRVVNFFKYFGNREIIRRS